MGRSFRIPVCPYCGGDSILVPDSQVYARSYGSFVYLCEPCRAWVGVHRGTDPPRPLGRLANTELRALKIQAHAQFDRLWLAAARLRHWSKGKSRRLGYTWLATEMGVDRKKCHIGYFDVKQTKRVIEICSAIGKKVAA